MGLQGHGAHCMISQPGHAEGGENIPSSQLGDAGRSRTIFPIVPRKGVCSLSPFSDCYLSWKRDALRELHANWA